MRSPRSACGGTLKGCGRGTGLAVDRCSLRADHRQRQETLRVATKPRQSCLQEDRLPCTRRSQHDHQTRWRDFREATKPVYRLDDRCLAAEEDPGKTF